jgi:hypothetical protein
MMKSPTLEDKIAYYAKVRKANYTDSLRLEGFDVGPKKPQKDDSSSPRGKKSQRSRA